MFSVRKKKKELVKRSIVDAEKGPILQFGWSTMILNAQRNYEQKPTKMENHFICHLK